jgi:hypothetical protein
MKINQGLLKFGGVANSCIGHKIFLICQLSHKLFLSVITA